MKTILLLSAVLCAVGLISQTPQGKEKLTPLLDHFDRRPARRVLIIGNSRTYWHQMPWMVRQIADSAHAPDRIEITTLAWGGASFEENWKSTGVQNALGQHWDQIILQPESRAETDDQTHGSFATYGEKLIEAGRSTNSPVALIINWGYGEELYGPTPTDERRQYIERLEQSERDLARNAGAQVIDTSAVWEMVHATDPNLPLYEDGNHPTIYGSYLSALMLEKFFWQSSNIQAMTYNPPDAVPKSLTAIKDAVGRFYQN